MPEQTSQTLQIAIGRLTKASFATNTFNSRIFYRSLYSNRRSSLTFTVRSWPPTDVLLGDPP